MQETMIDDAMQIYAIYSEFRTLSETDVPKLIMESETMSYILDLIPT